jgi:hypothetical protein
MTMKVLGWFGIVVMLGGLGSARCLPRKQGSEMNTQDVDLLLLEARNASQELPPRIRALEALAHMERPGLVPKLHELWDRPRSVDGPKPFDWDPDGAERVVDLYIILALAKSGEFSLLPQIAVRVSQGGDILRGPENEQRNAAKVVRAVGRLEPIEQLVALAGSGPPQAVTNAVRTLQFLGLPNPPTGGPVSAFPDLDAPLNFTIHRLKEELETIARLSNGRIVLSDGVKEWASHNDYERGEVRREATGLVEILTQQIDTLDLAYAVTQRGVVICTFKEAGARWRQKWPDYSRSLVYDGTRQSWRTP